ncbi:MAG: HpsJ family protein [Cyanobium sp.]
MSLDLWRENPDQAAMGSQLGLIGVSLLFLYIGSILVLILPLQILNPAWQLKFISTLINASSVGLVGLALVRLAAYVDPGNDRLRDRRDALAAWACAAAIGFLLLIPLQGHAAWKAWSKADVTRNTQLTTSERKVRDLRQAISSATSTEQLQRNLQALRARPLPPSALSTPLPRLQQQLLDTLQRSEVVVKERYGSIPPENVWTLIQNTVRNILSALVFAIAFAALAQRPGVDLSFFHEAQAFLEHRQMQKEVKGRKGGLLGDLGDSDRDYHLKISQTEDDTDQES